MAINLQKFLLILVGILIVFIIGLNLYLYRSSDKTASSSSPSPTVLREAKKVNLETCDLKKEGNPLVSDVTKLPDGTIVGNFVGNINKTESFVDGRLSLEVVAPRGDQTYTFTVREEEGLVFDLKEGKDLSLSDLAPGNTITMSFNCFPEKNNQFKITRITVTGKLN